jgi:hypothetical protein
MASITKSSGTLFPLISQMKDQNQGVVEPKLKRTVGQRQDVRTGDGLTTIMSKVWGLLKKQDEYNKIATKENTAQAKFRKESKDLMKKNNEVILKALNALSKDANSILTKILKTEDKSLKQQQIAIEEQKTSTELKNDFAKEDKKETGDIEEKRHQEIVELLKKMSGGESEGKNGKTKKEKKSFFEQFIVFMGGKFKDLLVSAFGSILGRDFAKILVSGLGSAMTSIIGPALKTIISEGIALALKNPLASIALALGSTAVALMNNEDEEIKKKGGQIAADAAKQRRFQEITGGLDESTLGSEIMNAAEGKTNTTDTIINATKAQSTQQFPSTVNVKPGAEAAGPAEQGTEALKQNLGSKIGGFNRITAVKDQYHKENAAHSKHNEGLAVDFTVKEKTPEAYAAAATQVREHLRSTGLKDGGTNPDFKVINEYATGTASHIHVQFRDKTAANQYLASSGKADTTQMASIQSPADATANQTATPAPEEQTKPKFLNDIIKDFAKMAQSEFDASESMFKLEGAGQTPSTNFNKTTPENIKLNAESKNQNKTPAASAIITNNIASNGGGNSGSSGVPLTARSNHSTLERAQTGMLATM